MPRVPQAEHTVQATGLPNVRSNAGINEDAYGAGLGRSVQQVAGVVGQFAQQERQKQDTAVLMGAERKLQEWQNQKLFAPETGEFAQRGQAAFGAVDRTLPEWDKQVADMESSMSENQRMVFRQRAGDMRTSMERDLMRHVGNEAETFQKGETAALVETRVNTAALYANDPQRFDKELREAQSAFLVGTPGLPPVAQKLGMQKIESSARSLVVNKLLRDDPLAAQRYYNEYRDTFTAEDGARLETVLEPSVDQAAGEAAGKTILSGGTVGAASNYTPNDDRAAAIKREADQLGIDPVDLATAISYETAGTFDPEKKGPTTKWGQHKGLIQFGEPQRAKYGVRDGMSFDKQMVAVGRYLKDAGVRPGMGLLDVYSAINAGSPGRYNASDAAAGGAPGTVADKVNGQMDAHRKKAAAMFKVGDVEIASPDSAAAAAMPAPAGPRSYTDALEVASKLPPGRTRDAAISYIETQQTLEKRRDAETEQAMLQSINTKVEQASPGAAFAKVVSPEELAWAQAHGHVAAYEGRLKQRAAGTDPDTPPDLLLAYRDVAAKAFAGDPTAQRELLSYKPYDPKMPMSMQDRDWLSKQQETLRAGSDADKGNAATEGEVNAIIKQHTISNLGVPADAIGKNNEQGQRAWKFYNDLRTWSDQFQREKKRAPSYQEVQQRADEMTLTFTRQEPGMFYGTNSVTSNIFDLDIPPDTLSDITTLLKSNGQPVTGANVAHVYRKMLTNKGKQ